MITKIVEQLKTGTYKNVVQFGVEQLPAPPYVVVKPEKDILNRGRSFRIIAHFKPGQNIMMEDYIIDELPDLLDNFSAESRHGNYNTLYTDTSTGNTYNDIVISNDDKTISMERIFLLPTRIF